MALGVIVTPIGAGELMTLGVVSLVGAGGTRTDTMALGVVSLIDAGELMTLGVVSLIGARGTRADTMALGVVSLISAGGTWTHTMALGVQVSIVAHDMTLHYVVVRRFPAE